jgi:penicillin-insensitive murein endopeptidase
MKKSVLILAFILVQTTAIQASEAIGYYSAGSIKDAESIQDRGTPIRKLFLQRGRFFGTQEMQDIISDAADFVRQEFPTSEMLQVGDIANKNGGALKEHGSHQNGLDADIVYLTRNGNLQSQTAAYWQEEFVKGGVVTANFNTERNLALFKHLIMNTPTERIFVDAAIKTHFCSYAKKNNLLNDSETKETLRRLRVEKLHTNHFHMRIKCPTTDLKCKAQAAVPAGTGC